MRVVHIHEDDEGMRNLYPLAALAEAVEDVAESAEAGERNRAPNGVGWTDVHAIREPKVTFAEMALSVEGIFEAISEYLPRIDRFAVGFGEGNPFAYSDDAPLCFGFGQDLYLKIEADDGRIEAVWFDVRGAEVDEIDALRLALEAVDRQVPVCIADYWMNVAGRVSDTTFMDGYSARLKEQAVQQKAAKAAAARRPAPAAPSILMQSLRWLLRRS